jgi:hypothetical protein
MALHTGEQPIEGQIDVGNQDLQVIFRRGVLFRINNRAAVTTEQA